MVVISMMDLVVVGHPLLLEHSTFRLGIGLLIPPLILLVLETEGIDDKSRELPSSCGSILCLR